MKIRQAKKIRQTMKANVLLLALVLTGPALAQENSALDELVTRDDLRGFEPVGRVDVENGGFCTGALIAPDLVLTAGHCVMDANGAPVDAGRITFRAGLSYGTAIVEAKVARTITDPAYRRVDPAPADMVAIDVALLQLADPIPSATISPFAVARPTNGDEVSVVSYAEGREEALSWQRVCHVIGREGPLIGFDCDVTFGSSGAPVLDRSGYRAKIVSIISAGSSDDGKPIALGMELPALVDRLKTALRQGKATSVATTEPAEQARIKVGNDAGAGTKVTGLPGKPAKRIILNGGTGIGAGTDGGARFVSPP
jgi:protease YdgD